jgi:hypothetical protein
MKTIQLTMSIGEAKPRTVRVLDLQGEEEVEDAEITHTPPDGGTTVTMEPNTIATPYVNFVMGPFVDIGTHLVEVKATGDGTPPSMPVVRYIIEVK